MLLKQVAGAGIANPFERSRQPQYPGQDVFGNLLSPNDDKPRTTVKQTRQFVVFPAADVSEGGRIKEKTPAA